MVKSSDRLVGNKMTFADYHFTPSELRVLLAILGGCYTVKEMAAATKLERGSVRAILNGIYKRLGLKGSGSLVATAVMLERGELKSHRVRDILNLVRSQEPDPVRIAEAVNGLLENA